MTPIDAAHTELHAGGWSVACGTERALKIGIFGRAGLADLGTPAGRWRGAVGAGPTVIHLRLSAAAFDDYRA